MTDHESGARQDVMGGLGDVSGVDLIVIRVAVFAVADFDLQ